MPINVFPLYEHILLKDLKDPTGGGLIPNGNEDIATGEVMRVGRGAATKNGIVGPTVQIGDKVIFIAEAGIKLEHAGETFYLLPEWATSGILDRDPSPEEILDYKGIDMKELEAQIDAVISDALDQPLEKRDPDWSDTQD